MLPVKRRPPTSSPLESLLLLPSRPNRGRAKEEAPEIPRPPLLPASTAPRAGADRERRISDGRWWGAGRDPSVSLAHSGLRHTKMGSDTHKATGGTNGGKGTGGWKRRAEGTRSDNNNGFYSLTWPVNKWGWGTWQKSRLKWKKELRVLVAACRSDGSRRRLTQIQSHLRRSKSVF